MRPFRKNGRWQGRAPRAPSRCRSIVGPTNARFRTGLAKDPYAVQINPQTIVDTCDRRWRKSAVLTGRAHCRSCRRTGWFLELDQHRALAGMGAAAICRCPSLKSKYNRRTSRVLRMDTRFPGTVTSFSEVTLALGWCPAPPNSFPQMIPDHLDHPSCSRRSLIGLAQEW